MSHTDNPSRGTTTATPARARTTGLVVAAIGIVIFNVAPFIAWVSTSDEGTERTEVTGYETDSLIPFIAYLGIGLLLSMIYATRRASRGQHRGLSLVSMAVALAAVLQCLVFAIDSMGGLERGYDLDIQAGVFVGLVGAIVWSVGSGLLAKEVEGDDRLDDDRGTDRAH
ncbi:hypothetical protein DT076_14275 [Desertihabitans brevis]|uniref:DUF4293 family protein n=1 Tax=Desertihabitans brevis TaxID=2268447 RepID=A0A367YSL4_9ACTN|nr:hypothetical protein [Desertihabitans brevis]RCK68747.1 hypothetical protein DT076_14275 [Desertihabitans brevis]